MRVARRERCVPTSLAPASCHDQWQWWKSSLSPVANSHSLRPHATYREGPTGIQSDSTAAAYSNLVGRQKIRGPAEGQNRGLWCERVREGKRLKNSIARVLLPRRHVLPAGLGFSAQRFMETLDISWPPWALANFLNRIRMQGQSYGLRDIMPSPRPMPKPQGLRVQFRGDRGRELRSRVQY